MEDGDDLLFANRDGMCDGVVEVGRRCVFFGVLLLRVHLFGD